MFLNIETCLVCVCLILKKKTDTCTKYQFFNSRERIHLIPVAPLCLFLLVPSFFLLFFESRKRNPRSSSPSTQPLDPWLGFMFLRSPLHLQHSKTQQRIISYVTVDPSLQDPGSNMTFTLLGNGFLSRDWV